VLGTRLEVRDVAALGNGQDEGFGRPFHTEVIFQLLAKVPDLDPDNIILVGAEVRPASQNLAANFLFADGGGMIGQHAVGDVEKNLAELRRLGKMAAGGHALDQSPTLIPVEGSEMLRVLIE